MFEAQRWICFERGLMWAPGFDRANLPVGYSASFCGEKSIAFLDFSRFPLISDWSMRYLCLWLVIGSANLQLGEWGIERWAGSWIRSVSIQHPHDAFGCRSRLVPHHHHNPVAFSITLFFARYTTHTLPATSSTRLKPITCFITFLLQRCYCGCAAESASIKSQ